MTAATSSPALHTSTPVASFAQPYEPATFQTDWLTFAPGTQPYVEAGMVAEAVMPAFIAEDNVQIDCNKYACNVHDWGKPAHTSIDPSKYEY